MGEREEGEVRGGQDRLERCRNGGGMAGEDEEAQGGWEGRGRRCRELLGGFAVPRSAADQLLSVGCGMWDSYW